LSPSPPPCPPQRFFFPLSFLNFFALIQHFGSSSPLPPCSSPWNRLPPSLILVLLFFDPFLGLSFPNSFIILLRPYSFFSFPSPTHCPFCVLFFLSLSCAINRFFFVLFFPPSPNLPWPSFRLFFPPLIAGQPCLRQAFPFFFSVFSVFTLPFFFPIAFFNPVCCYRPPADSSSVATCRPSLLFSLLPQSTFRCFLLTPSPHHALSFRM